MSRRRPRPDGAEVVYGRNPVRELLAAGRREVHEVVALPQLAGEPWLAGADVRTAGRDELGRIAGTADHQGVVALTGAYPYAEPAELLARPGPVVCLDGAQDPRNLGAIARVAEAAGAAGIVIQRRGSPGVTPVVAKASAGAVEHLAIARVGSMVAFLHDARGGGRLAIGAHPDGAEDYRALAWPRDVLLVMGAEGEGLRPRVRESCDHLARIPMAGRVASLNISVATALLLYETLRT
ncbi:TrmH family RNA methyltransferase [Miltoncostaea marina]|uniref:TrmH family RNA methyltransferase n=1 Tax=Miltoncostaea marina TaxID=2843215 RepID=UPI001C3CD43B|nr:RNA methyltransferase [Miltoncostaea marina]